MNTSDSDDAEIELEEDGSEDGNIPDISYNVASYGSDPDVDTLVRRIQNNTIEIPNFQRGYVWSIKEASKFVESLLLGLPVPGVFFADDSETGKQLVIDGQQRLRSLQFFYEGYFNPNKSSSAIRVFKLSNVQDRYEGKTYKDLEEKDRLKLDHSIIHATIVKQIHPTEDDTSMYHIFARLNAGGKKLAEQEIRVALYHGPLIEMLERANNIDSWREIYGNPSSRLKDQELILRFLALYEGRDNYAPPMSEFLNLFANRHKGPKKEALENHLEMFSRCITLFNQALGRRAFRVRTAMNTAIYDACMVGLSKRLEVSEPSCEEIGERYSALLESKDFIASISRATARPDQVRNRISMAIDAFKQ